MPFHPDIPEEYRKLPLHLMSSVIKKKMSREEWELQVQPIRAEIVRIYINGSLSQADCGNLFGVSQAEFGHWLNKLGIKAKPRYRLGEGNGKYIDGTQSILYRRMVEKKECNRCGSKDNLVIHHKDGNHKNNVVPNLEVVCSPCHSSRHKTEYWRKVKSVS